jgi:hypothetical protein
LSARRDRVDLVVVGDAATELDEHFARHVLARAVAERLFDQVGPALRRCARHGQTERGEHRRSDFPRTHEPPCC